METYINTYKYVCVVLAYPQANCGAVFKRGDLQAYEIKIWIAHEQVVVLYVDMETSIKRQKERAKLASLHNERVMDAGAGQLW